MLYTISNTFIDRKIVYSNALASTELTSSPHIEEDCIQHTDH